MNDRLSKQIFMNSLFIYLGRSINLIINFIIFIHIANYLGVQNFGVFSIALTLVATSDIVSNFGINQIVVRELASTSSERNIILGNAILLKLLFSSSAVIICILLAIIIGYDFEVQIIVAVVALNLLISSKLSSYRSIFETPFQTDLLMVYPMIYNSLDSFVFMGAVLLVTQVFHFGLLGVAIGYTVANIPGFIFLIINFFRFNKVKIRIEKKLLKYMIMEMMPVAAYLALSTLNTKIDIILLSKLSSKEQVGIFSAAVRLVYPLIFFATSFTLSLFPLLSKFYSTERERFYQVFRLGLKVVSIISLFFVMMLCCHSHKIIDTFYIESYSQSATAFRLLAIALAFNFFNFYFVDLFISMKKQRYNTIILFFALLLNLLLNIIFIPSYGFYAAAWARVMTSAFVFFSFYFFILKNLKKLAVLPGRRHILFAFAFMSLQIALAPLNIFLIAILGLIGFVSLLFLLRIISKDEIEFFRVLIMKKP